MLEFVVVVDSTGLLVPPALSVWVPSLVFVVGHFFAILLLVLLGRCISVPQKGGNLVGVVGFLVQYPG